MSHEYSKSVDFDRNYNKMDLLIGLSGDYPQHRETSTTQNTQ